MNSINMSRSLMSRSSITSGFFEERNCFPKRRNNINLLLHEADNLDDKGIRLLREILLSSTTKKRKISSVCAKIKTTVVDIYKEEHSKLFQS